MLSRKLVCIEYLREGEADSFLCEVIPLEQKASCCASGYMASVCIATAADETKSSTANTVTECQFGNRWGEKRLPV